MIQKKYYKLVKVDFSDEQYFCIRNITNSDGTLSYTGSNNGIQYSFGDTSNWQNITNYSIVVPANTNMYMRGNNPNGLANNIYSPTIFTSTFDFTISGNICSLINYDKTSVTSLPTDAFYRLFYQNTHLKSVNINTGNVKTCGKSIFRDIFRDSGVETLNLDMSQVETLYNSTSESESLFGQGNLTGTYIISVNINLENITSLPDYTFSNKFSYCTLLTNAVIKLDNTSTVGNRAFSGTFFGCTSLTTAPDMSSVNTIGDYGCYQMFNNCSSLTTGPDMSSVTSVGSNGCYNMFSYCSHLSSATAPNVSTWDTSKFYNWLSSAGTQATGTKTVYKPAALTIPTNTSDGVPTGWTVENY